MPGHIVTGSSGMAEATALLLAQGGRDVFIIGIDETESEQLAARVSDLGGNGSYHSADLTDADQAATAFAAAAAHLGRVQGVFGTVGGSGRRFGDGPLHEVDLNGWAETLRLNATSSYLTAHHALRLFLDQSPDPDGGRGSLLLMSSILATHPAPDVFATHAYAAAKGAIESLTRTTASYYASHQIRVNAVAPAVVETPMSQRAAKDPKTLAYITHRQPLAKGLMRADDVASLAVFLMSAESRNITGQIVTIDAGWSVSGCAP